jgi:hypothetical protein
MMNTINKKVSVVSNRFRVYLDQLLNVFIYQITVWERRDISLFIAATDPWTSQK